MSVYLKNFRFPRIWLFIALLQITFIYYLCLKESLDAPPLFLHQDKAFHFSAYFLLAGYLFSILKEELLWKLFLSLFLMGLSIELLQLTTKTRSYENLDLVANTLGIVMGIFISKFIRLQRLLQKIEITFSQIDK